MYYFQNFSNFNVECKHGKHKTAFRARKLYWYFRGTGHRSYWLKNCFNQSEDLPWYGLSHVISVEFLHSFLRRHSGVPKCLLFCQITHVAFITNITIGTRLNKRIGLLVSMIFTESNKRTISVWLRFIFCIYFKGILQEISSNPKCVCNNETWEKRSLLSWEVLYNGNKTIYGCLRYERWRRLHLEIQSNLSSRTPL